ncbi:antigen UB05, putative [Plasmodium berghei]|uniref:Antigen UB05, putative n=1 Tax=Plasmodium berghei TaxID=5821 RepID=A0A1C6WUV6_PLABE|nr:antigen UB05, putative [Plasmodium berghei]SCN23162.1 antigen UB05, putative [Plasmodium berghei]
MGSHIQPSRFLDSAILSLFAMVISASFLYMFSEFYLLAFEAKLFDNKTFEYNLTHILLFTLCIILLSLKPDYSFCSKISSRESRRYQGKDESSRMDDSERSQRDKKK